MRIVFAAILIGVIALVAVDLMQNGLPVIAR